MGKVYFKFQKEKKKYSHFVNLKSVEGTGFACMKKKGAAESETGSSVLFVSVKGLLESTDTICGDGTFGSWQLKCTFGCCCCCHWPEMEWKKLHHIGENIKQISEHKQLTTLNNVDCRISNNNARIQKAIDNLKSLFLLALLRGKAIFIDYQAQRMSAFRQPTEPNQNCNLSSLMIEEVLACIQEQMLMLMLCGREVFEKGISCEQIG
ncbi:hypothetical protein T10_907 [Trichinella papuae]|uniref:Uncharacterized protein n=1 Tax=Trichinella papuae TaxID=268474 RepID=A0A0V1MUA7_9BILA|nr:hypothetical protein T10_907 [Trichinella papuae]